MSLAETLKNVLLGLVAGGVYGALKACREERSSYVSRRDVDVDDPKLQQHLYQLSQLRDQHPLASGDEHFNTIRDQVIQFMQMLTREGDVSSSRSLVVHIRDAVLGELLLWREELPANSVVRSKFTMVKEQLRKTMNLYTMRYRHCISRRKIHLRSFSPWHLMPPTVTKMDIETLSEHLPWEFRDILSLIAKFTKPPIFVHTAEEDQTTGGVALLEWNAESCYGYLVLHDVVEDKLELEGEIIIRPIEFTDYNHHPPPPDWTCSCFTKLNPRITQITQITPAQITMETLIRHLLPSSTENLSLIKRDLLTVTQIYKNNIISRTISTTTSTTTSTTITTTTTTSTTITTTTTTT
jgi:hypothetical protein